MSNETPTSFPAGSVVFVPDGEPRRLRPNEWYEVKKYAGSGIARTAQATVERFQVYTRIDLPAAVHVVTGEMCEAFRGVLRAVPCSPYSKKLWCIEDIIDAVRGLDRAFSVALDVNPTLPPAPVVKAPEKTVREQADAIIAQTKYPWSDEGKEMMRMFADRLDAIEARMKEGAKP